MDYSFSVCKGTDRRRYDCRSAGETLMIIEDLEAAGFVVENICDERGCDIDVRAKGIGALAIHDAPLAKTSAMAGPQSPVG